MKKVFLAAVLAVSTLAASAQIWVGGSLGFDSFKPEGGDAINSISIAPEVGYTLNEKWDVAVAVSFDMEDDATGWSVEPYARYTFAKMDKVSFFVDGGLGYATGDFNADALYVGLRPGIKLAVNDNISFVANLGWIGYESVEDTYTNLGIGVGGSDLSFGMYWAF